MITHEQFEGLIARPEPRIQALHTYPFQLKTARHMIRWPQTINGLPTGKGKTITSIATTDALRLFPVAIVCSKRVALQWAGEYLRWMPGQVSVTVLEGQRPRDFNGEYFYTLCGTETVQVPINDLSADVIIAPYSVVYYWAEKLASLGLRALVIDELRIRSRRTLQFHACNYLGSWIEKTNHRQHIYGLSADSIVNRPRDFHAILEVLNLLKRFGGWRRFRTMFCDPHVETRLQEDGTLRQYTTDSGASNLALLNRKLKYLGVLFRMTEQECVVGAPEKVRVMIPVQLSNQAEYDRAESDLIKYVRELAIVNRGFNERLDGMSTEMLLSEALKSRLRVLNPERAALRDLLLKHHADTAQRRAARSEALARITVLRRLVGLGKVGAMIKFKRDFWEENPGKKFVSFAHHVDCQEALVAASPGCARIAGKQKTQESDGNKNRFQTDPLCHDIVVSEEAGGEGLTLSAAWYLGILEYPWTAKGLNQMEGRCHLRMDNPHGITAYYFHAANTIDDRIRKIVDRKARIASMVIDGVEADDFLSRDLSEEVLRSYTEDHQL